MTVSTKWNKKSTIWTSKFFILLVFTFKIIQYLQQMETPTLLNAQQAIRLYNSVKISKIDENVLEPNVSNDEISESTNQLPTCRICRVESTEEVIETPCDCKGTVGFIHRKCMKIWHYKRKSKVCEICNKLQIDNTVTVQNVKQRIGRLFKNRLYLWRITRDLVNLSSITIMVFCNLNQSLDLFDYLVDKNSIGFPTKSLIIQGITMYSGYFLHLYFLWVHRIFQNIRANIFRVKWVLDSEEQLPPPFDDDVSTDSYGFENLFQFP